MPQLIDTLAAFVPFKIDKDSIELDACDEPGRIDIAGMETDDGAEPTARQLDAWKTGNLPLFYDIKART